VLISPCLINKLLSGGLLTNSEVIMSRKKILSGLAVAMFCSAGFAVAADVAPGQTQDRAQNRQTVGRQIMTDEERNEQRAKMRSTTSQEERNKVRAEQHEKMKQRAKEKGVTLPDNPPAQGQGGGMGGGMGGGQGGGMGGGGRGGR
jgi:Ni/Co efflux regulator RcnB